MKDHCFQDSQMLRRASLILMMYHLSAEGVACRLDVQAIAVFLAGALLVFLSFSAWVCSLFLEGIDTQVSRGIAGISLGAAVVLLGTPGSSRTPGGSCAPAMPLAPTLRQVRIYL